MSDFRGSNVGDLTQGNVAETIYNVTTSLEQVTTILREDYERLQAQVDALEIIERQHTTERQALTRLITMLATESRTVKDVQDLLTRQIDSESEERAQRRKYLDTMLTALVVLAVVNVAITIIRVLRGSGRAA